MLLSRCFKATQAMWQSLTSLFLRTAPTPSDVDHVTITTRSPRDAVTAHKTPKPPCATLQSEDKLPRLTSALLPHWQEFQHLHKRPRVCEAVCQTTENSKFAAEVEIVNTRKRRKAALTFTSRTCPAKALSHDSRAVFIPHRTLQVVRSALYHCTYWQNRPV